MGNELLISIADKRSGIEVFESPTLQLVTIEGGPGQQAKFTLQSVGRRSGWCELNPLRG